MTLPSTRVPRVEVRLVPVGEPQVMRQIEKLLMETWGRETPQVGGDVLQALRLSGNYVAVAYAEGDMVGAAVGFVGVDETRPPHLHSHIVGVKPGVQVRGIGFALKQHQRSWALDRGLKTVSWTYDPLVRRNAYFNLSKLGASATEYHVNLYGPMGDGINREDDSDRIVVDWDLESPRAVAGAAGRAAEPDLDALRAAGAVAALTDVEGEPALGPVHGDVVLCQVPADIVAIRRERPDVARAWRLAVRETVGKAMQDGWTNLGATRSGWYALRRNMLRYA